MVHHNCCCSYIPPHILDKLAKHPDDDVRTNTRSSILQAKLVRDKRAARPIEQVELTQGATQLYIDRGVAAAAGEPALGTASRLVYNSEHLWQQRVTLARVEGGPATGNEDVDKVYDQAGTVRDYFKSELSRNSIDNFGMNLILNVHYGASFMNAFWDGDEMTFGDGDGVIFTSFAKSLDVTAHELTHGVTQFTANLEYFSQSGALNEHFSDVFGTVITQHHLGQTAEDADWLIGNEIMGPDLYGEALRSMKAPGTAYDNNLLGADPQPSHMKDYYHGSGDNQGVHINSGIMNKVFYLVATDQVGTAKAAKIWYHALQNLWATAKFNDAAEVLVNSARILTRDGVVPEGTTQTVRLAFKEVGISA